MSTSSDAASALASAQSAAASAAAASTALGEAVDLVVAPNDSTVATLVNAPTSSTALALSATFARIFSPQSYDSSLVTNGVYDCAPAIQDAIDAASAAGGGMVWFTRGTYGMATGVTVPSNVFLMGEGRWSVLYATAAMTNMVHFKVTGSRGYGGGISNLLAHGHALADYGVRVNTWHHFQSTCLYGADFVKRLAHVRPDEGSGYCESIVFEHPDLAPSGAGNSGLGLALVEAGAAGTCTEVVFRDPSGGGITDYGVILNDVARCFVVGTPYFGNGTTDFLGGVLITNTNTAAGAPASTGDHVIENVYIENPVGTSAVAVHIKGAASVPAGRLMWGSFVRGTLAHPLQARVLFKVECLDTDTYMTGNVFENPRGPAGGTGMVVVGANVFQTKIVIPSQNAVAILGMVSDSGTATSINGWKKIAAGVGGTPATTFVDLGDMVENPDDHTFWVCSRSDGVMRKLA